MENFIKLVTDNFQDCIWLAVLIVSLMPTLESKIAIPLAMNGAFWGNNAYSPAYALLLSFLGSMIPCIILMILARKLKSKTSFFITSKFFDRYKNKTLKIEQEKSNFKKYLLLTCFVAIPIPLTGVWTASIIAGFSNLNLKNSFCSILIGSFISACAITLLCTLFNNSLSYILIISIAIVVLFLFLELLISNLKQIKRKS